MELTAREIIIMIVGFLIIGGVFGLLFWSTNKTNKARWAAIDPDKAKPMNYCGSCYTGTKGHFFVRVSPMQWVEIYWDKSEELLIIYRPPGTWKHNKEFPVYLNEMNWKVVKECQPKRVTVEEYFVRQVM